MDADADGNIELHELKEWIQYTQKKYITDDIDRQWKTHNPEEKDQIAWEDYRKIVYGFMDDMDPQDLEKNEDNFSYDDMKKRDERRWKVADRNGDG